MLKKYMLEVRFDEHLNFLFPEIGLTCLLSNLVCKTNNKAKKENYSNNNNKTINSSYDEVVSLKY